MWEGFSPDARAGHKAGTGREPNQSSLSGWVISNPCGGSAPFR